MKQWVQATVIAVLASGSAVAPADDPIKPLKVPAAQAAGPIFDGPGVQHDNRFGPMSNLALLNSKDKRFTAGLYKAGAGEFQKGVPVRFFRSIPIRRMSSAISCPAASSSPQRMAV
jgi:hypothetical protein